MNLYNLKTKFQSWILVIMVCFIFCYTSSNLYAWDTANGVAICTASDNQITPLIVSDGSGGAIISWYDFENTTGHPTQGTDIYAQRVNSSGSTVWKVNGVAICTAINNQNTHAITDDNAGGAFIVWQDVRGTTGNINQGSDIYGQHVNSQGSTLWAVNGIGISTATNYQLSPQITGDGSGNAIVAFMDYRFGNYDIYAQKVNSSGSTLWTLDGVAICTNLNQQYYPTITSDSAGGAIITWYDLRNGPNDIYAQHVNSSGSTLWTNNGIAICTAAHEQYYPQIISDGSGGAIIVWYDFRNNANTVIYAQRVNSSGSTLWAFNGVSLCTATGDQALPTVVSDGAHGAIVTWEDYRKLNYDIYAQRINSSGSTLWTLNGLALSTVTGFQETPTIASDGSGGAIICWQDFRAGSFSRIFAQHVNSSGSTLWALDGLSLCTVTGGQAVPVITTNGSGGAIVAWMDYRKVFENDIYAQTVSNSGQVPVEDWEYYSATLHRKE